MVLLAGIHAELQPLGRPGERLEHPRGQARTLGHVWVAAHGEQTEVVKPRGTQQEFAIERSVAGKTLSDHELAQAVALERTVRARRGPQRLQGAPRRRAGRQRARVHDAEPNAMVPMLGAALRPRRSAVARTRLVSTKQPRIPHAAFPSRSNSAIRRAM